MVAAPDILEELEQRQFEVVNDAIDEVCNTSLYSYKWDEDEYKEMSFVTRAIERMGFTLKEYDEDTLIHVYTSGIWECTIEPHGHILKLLHKQPSGTMFSSFVGSVRETRPDYLITKFAKIYFLHDDWKVDEMIKADKKLWNEEHSEKLGTWK